MSNPNEKLTALGIELPEPTVPQGSYTPCVQAGNLVFVSGQGPRYNGELIYKEVVGDTLNLEQGQDAARICGLNLISHIKRWCGGDLRKVKRVVRLAGVVRCTSDFTDQAKVMNGASDLMRDVFGDAGIHARIATGTHALPSGMSVEIEAVFELET